MFRSMTCALAAGCAAAFTPTASMAAGAEILVEATDVPTRVVRADLASLESDVGRAAVERELRSAARAVCREHYRLETVYSYAQACYSAAARDALTQLDRLAPIGRVGTAAAGVGIVEVMVRAR